MGKLIADETRMFYVAGLRNAHAMETQAIQLLTRQVERLENYPELEARMREHLEESKAQRARLEEVLHGMDEDYSALKEAVLGLGGNFAALSHTAASDEIIKNTLANYMFEHFEIAAYKSLIAMSEHLGHPAGAVVASTSLREEERMAAWIDERIGTTTLTFLQRVEAGVTADH
jgi:ferritin-like metal-binding protein YciE